MKYSFMNIYSLNRIYILYFNNAAKIMSKRTKNSNFNFHPKIYHAT